MKLENLNIFKKYLTICESEDISNTFSNQASTKYTTDNTAKFLPVGQDVDDQEKVKQEIPDKIQEKLKTAFSQFKELIKRCEDKNCNSKDIAELLSLMDNPEFKKDLQQLKDVLELKKQEMGVNAVSVY
jgi:hypothetical protein